MEDSLCLVASCTEQACAVAACCAVMSGQEWERHRLPLIKAIRDARAEGSRRRERAAQLVEEIKQCRYVTKDSVL